MSKKLKIKIDLAKERLMDEDPSNANKDRSKQLEEKLEGFILRFINLNADNKYVLEDASKELNKVFDQKIALVDLKMHDNVKEMSGYAIKDEKKTKSFKNELEIYVNEIHTEVQKMESKRMKDMDAQLNLIVKLKDENLALKKKINQTEQTQQQIKKYLQNYNEKQTFNRLYSKRSQMVADDSLMSTFEQTSMQVELPNVLSVVDQNT